MLTLLLLAIPAAEPPARAHAAVNAVYRELLDVGAIVGPDARAKLPPPTVPDGMAPAAQTAAVKTLIGEDYAWDEFARRSAVAPHLLRFRDVKAGDPLAPPRGLGVWFVVYGDLPAADDDKLLDRLLGAGRGDGKGTELTAADLAKRKIPAPGDATRERYGHVEFDVLDRVRLGVTGRAVWSRTPESVVAAAAADPRFLGDAEFPSEWRPLTKTAGGLAAGPPQPYGGAGVYLKVTRLAEPAGALFVEQHVVFAEPAGWFDGANLLRSKLPPVVQSNVRTMRREWAKGKE